MGVRFSKSIKIGKLLRINFSKSGVSATLGKKGASVNVGTKGAYVNLSPSAVGINGTGISYRQKIGGGLNKKKKTKKVAHKYQSSQSGTSSVRKSENIEEVYEENVNQETPYIEEETEETVSVVDEYNERNEMRVNIHKYAEPVVDKETFAASVENMESQAAKEIYEAAIAGDEDTIEEQIANFMNNLDLSYDVRCNYELEDNVLYVDLDLPEIEDLDREYPAYNRDKIVYKRKTSAQMKEEYARLIMSLGVYLSANFFNLSSYIDQIVLSAFTSSRNSKGDLEDQYLYSVKYTREIFENTDFGELDDLYRFILQFDNRINMSTSFSFKPIEPYAMESVEQANSALEDALLGLKELGYKAADINAILPKLKESMYDNSSDYLKEGLRLLKEKRQS